VVEIKEENMLAFGLNIEDKGRTNDFSLNRLFDEYTKSEALASLNQYIGRVYDNLTYNEDPHLHCREPTQHSWELDPS
jgi:hypothetical protein